MAATEQAKTKKKRPTALKREIQNAKRQQINSIFKSRLRTAVRHLENELKKNGEASALGERLNQVYALADKGVKRGILKLNTASRIKSRLSARVQSC